MSLFQAREYWQAETDTPSPVHSGSLFVGSLFTKSDEQAAIVVGDLDGILRIYLPKGRGYTTEDLVLEKTLSPILQICTGTFSDGNSLELCILHPRQLSICSLKVVGSGVQMTTVYEIPLKRTAANMTHGKLGNAPHDIACVQSMDGVLSFFSKGRFAFERYLPEFLLPGPLCYVEATDTLITVDSTWVMRAYKFVTIAASKEAKDKQAATSGGGKKITEDWSLNIGEDVLSVDCCGPDKSTLLVAGSETLFWVGEEGSVLKAKRLESAVACLLPLRTVGERIDALLCCHDGILRVLQDVDVVWAASGLEKTLALQTIDFKDTKGMVVALNENGSVTCVYMGTDPSLPELSRARPVDQESLDSEMRRLNRVIETAQAGNIQTPTADNLIIEVAPFHHIEPQPSEDNEAIVFEQATLITLNAPFDKTATGVTARVVCNMPIVCDTSAIALDSDLTMESSASFEAAFALVPGLVPASLTATLIVSYKIDGSARVVEEPIDLPVTLAYSLAQAQKSANFKLTLHSSLPCVLLSTLFEDEFGKLEPTPALGFQPFGSNDIVSVIAAKSSNRYRIQSDDYPALAAILELLLVVIQRHYDREGTTIELSLKEMIPLPPLFAIIDHHLEMRHVHKRICAVMDDFAAQYRVLQKRLLGLVKDPSPGEIDSVLQLIETTHTQITAVADDQMEQLEDVRTASASLAAAVQLYVTSLQLFHQLNHRQAEVIKAVVNPHAGDDEEQGWEELTLISLHQLLDKFAGHKRGLSSFTFDLPENGVSIHEALGTLHHELSTHKSKL
eukprot:m.26816 g.26816  ORF g.26816 m.26816 type:complete len:790 (-) comp8876_c0_seq2:342-2711(-)